MVEDEIRSMQPNFEETLSDEVLISFKENLKFIAQSMFSYTYDKMQSVHIESLFFDSGNVILITRQYVI